MGARPLGGEAEKLPSANVAWYLSTWFILAHATVLGACAVIVVLIMWNVGVPPSAASALMFAAGAAIGLMGVRPMVEIMRAGEPYRKLREQFTRGRFLTLACPTLSPRYWRACRELKGRLRAEGVSPEPAVVKQLLAMVPLGVAVGGGLAAELWLNAPRGSSALAFLGCILAWGDLSVMLSRPRVHAKS